MAFAFRAFNRVFMYALGGALVMAFAGIIEGAIAGPIMIAVASLEKTGGGFDILGLLLISPVAAVVGAAYAAAAGAVSGALAFAFIGAITLTADPNGIASPIIARRAVRGSALGVALGGVTGAVNALLLTLAVPRGFSLRVPVLSVDMMQPSGGFTLGVIIGFAIGTFLGAIRGALDENKKQRALKSTPE